CTGRETSTFFCAGRGQSTFQPKITMASTKPSLLVTGVAGDLGTRLLPLLEGFHVIGLDTRPPSESSVEFEQIDLSQEAACGRMAQILRETKAVGVVHLAFVLDPVRTGVLDQDRMWRINVAGTARVVEAIAEANRMGGKVAKLIYLSSVAAYGPNLKRPARENDELKAHTLTYALHKKEADLAVQARARELGGCDVYILRPPIFAGASVQNYMINCIRGTAYGPGRIGQAMSRKRRKLPMLLPFGRAHLERKFQFVHVDDVARLIAWILARPKASDSLTILNVAGRGEPITVAQCGAITGNRIKRVPTVRLCRKIVEMMWNMGVSSVPPDSFPYLIGSYVMDTSRLQNLLASSYEDVIRLTNEMALQDEKESRQTDLVDHKQVEVKT
ncbi:MAG TPA: NAD-dependent epimerase/dehydratase family protein, partial [Terriglobales bacterium]|nr:NAD-dependent epimerase/dehydratase family protein [Terriglobales bacterium]